MFLPGHSWMLQLSVMFDDPAHESCKSWSSSALSARNLSSLVFVLIPPPQVFEHVPIIHSSHSQWTIQRNTFSVGYCLFWIFVVYDIAMTNVSLMICIYIPGQGCWLHCSISNVCPVQVPPWASCIVLVRLFIRVPVPHFFVHSPKTQSLHTQCIA